MGTSRRTPPRSLARPRPGTRRGRGTVRHQGNARGVGLQQSRCRSERQQAALRRLADAPRQVAVRYSCSADHTVSPSDDEPVDGSSLGRPASSRCQPLAGSPTAGSRRTRLSASTERSTAGGTCGSRRHGAARANARRSAPSRRRDDPSSRPLRLPPPDTATRSLRPVGRHQGFRSRDGRTARTRVGAEIMGAGKFGPPGWQDAPEWRGWWGDNPPFHAPTYVLTHHVRPSLEMEGGTTVAAVVGSCSISDRRVARAPRS